MAATRTADVAWSGDLIGGTGTITAVGSGAFGSLPVSWAARTEASDGKTSPEELLAAAHASCFAMALSGALARAGTPPESLAVTATVTFDKGDDGWRVTTSALAVSGRVPGASEASFVQAAEATKDGCPISKALVGNVALSVEATLEG
ncbi:MAG TPA: OsmC family peroxiredoxin [Candidatus Limnocylindrales bacterium]|jgi:osmotically inducible protein OsmC